MWFGVQRSGAAAGKTGENGFNIKVWGGQRWGREEHVRGRAGGGAREDSRCSCCPGARADTLGCLRYAWCALCYEMHNKLTYKLSGGLHSGQAWQAVGCSVRCVDKL